MSSRRVVVTGATGFVGGELCARLRRSGRPLIGLARRAVATVLPDLHVIGDLRRVDDGMLDDTLGDACAVVHLAGRAHVMRERSRDAGRIYREINTEVTARLAQAARRAGVERFIFASSVKAMGEETEPGRPFRPDDVPDPRDDYGRSKLAAERAVLDAAADSPMIPVILRLPLVYGRHAKGNFARLVAAVLRGRPLPLASIDNRRSILYVRNLAGAIEAALDAPTPPLGVHLLADDRSVSTPDLARAIAQAWQVPIRLTALPVWMLEAAGLLSGRRHTVQRLTRSLEVDTSSFRALTGWQPQYTLERALARIAAHSRPSGHGGGSTTRPRDLPAP